VHLFPRVLNLFRALEADLIASVIDGEDAAQVGVTAAKEEPMYTSQDVHKSCALCLLLQSPLASSHSSSERTLAVASAIEQSAAP